jgi:hypothetical protein
MITLMEKTEKEIDKKELTAGDMPKLSNCFGLSLSIAEDYYRCCKR